MGGVGAGGGYMTWAKKITNKNLEYGGCDRKVTIKKIFGKNFTFPQIRVIKNYY
jgi:hypothetical protein